MKIKLLIIFIITTFGVNAQTNLKYSGLFDSYYKTGPIKFTLEPCLTKMYGDLKKGGPSAGIGAGANYKILPPLYLTTNFRYLTFAATDHDETRNASYKGSTMQLNLLADYHFIYDLTRNHGDRRRGSKFINAYFSTGASLNLYKADSGTTPAFHLPLILGLPLRVTPKFTITPEIGYFMTFSDNLDAITGVGSNNSNDGYAVFSLKLMFSPFDKRRKPKPIKASNGGNNSESGNPNFDDDGDDFDDFDSNSDIENNIEEEEEEEEEIINDIEEEEEEKLDDSPVEEENEEEEDTPKFDEDGFLIDE